MHKVTLGIPIYNAANLVERTLLSAFAQTYPAIEFLLIDDKGNSMDIVRKVLSEHPRGREVRIIDQKENRGIGAARNAIIDNATGDYLFTMDCDDVITPDCIETLYRKMQEHPVDLVAGSFVRRDLAGNEYPGGYLYEDTLVEGGTYPLARYHYGAGKIFSIATWNKLYNLAFLRDFRIRCKDDHMNEDPWFTYQVIMNARSFRLIPECTLYYTYNTDSVCGITALKGYSEKIARQYVDIQWLKSDYIRFLTKENFYRNLLEDIMFMSIYDAYRIGASSQLTPIQKKIFQSSLLTAAFTSPSAQRGGKRTLKYLMLRLYFSLPMVAKRGIVNLSATLDLKRVLRKFLHFRR